MLQVMDSVDVKSLDLNESPIDDSQLNLLSESSLRHWPKTPFPIDQDLNRRVVIYNGDIVLLRAEALVNPTNENLTNLGLVTKLAGPELESYIRKKIRLCATGNVRTTPGFDSNFKYIIHAVPPKYQPKYKTAAETALFHTYFRILETMIERKIRTVVMPVLTTTKCNLPIEDNCHLQLRIIRRILEKKRHEFDRIVIHVEDIDVYSRLFYCYFPQSHVDEEFACYNLPPTLGGPNGEPVIPEREIRIKSKPGILSLNSSSNNNNNNNNDNSIDLSSGLDLSTVVGKTAFSKMRDDFGSENRDKSPSATSNSRSHNQSSSMSNQLVVRKAMFRGCNLL